MDINISDIFIDDEFNCRGDVIPNDVRDLMKDIDANGLLQPVIVMPHDGGGYKYKLVAGFRRTYAHIFLKRETVRAEVVNITSHEARIVNLKENLIRSNLNIIQEATAIKALMRENNLNQSQVAEELGKTPAWVNMRIKALDTDEATQDAIRDGTLSSAHVAAIVRMKKVEDRHAVIRKVKEHRERGEKLADIKTFQRKRVKPNVKKARQRHEIFEMNSFLIDQNVSGLVTRALAWASGEVTDIEFYDDIEKDFPHFVRPTFSESDLL